jgi:DNA polymerase elongation subunit (family B)
VKNRYDKLLLSEKKKRYIGFEKGKIDVVGYDAEKSNSPKYYEQVFGRLINDIIKDGIDPIPNIRRAFSEYCS